MDRATRRSADGRWPVDNGTACFDVAVHQIKAATVTNRSSPRAPRTGAPPPLDADDVTVLTGWAEAVVEALAHDPDRTAAVLSHARSEATWRAAMGLEQPSAQLRAAIDALSRFALADGAPNYDALLAAAGQEPEDEQPLDKTVRRVLLSMLEERRTRSAES